MNTQPSSVLRLTLILLVGSVSFSTARAQSPPPTQNATASQNTAPMSVADYLKSQYKLTKTGNDSTGFVVLEAGIVLVLQKGGVLGVLPTSSVICPSTYKDGNLNGPNSFCHAMVAQTSRFLTVGEKLYVTKIDVNMKNERVSMTLLECDSCNGVTQPSSMRSIIAFQFSKGYLEAADPGQVQDTIGQVLQVDSGNAGAPQQGQDPQGQNPQQSNPPAQAAQPPTKISPGMTVDQVKAALEDPVSIAEVGPKTIYVYKDLKITFVNGKVSDVQ